MPRQRRTQQARQPPPASQRHNHLEDARRRSVRCNTGGHASGAERHAPPARPSTTLGTRATHASGRSRDASGTRSAQTHQASSIRGSPLPCRGGAAGLPPWPSRPSCLSAEPLPGEWIWPLFHPFGEQGFPYTEHISGKFQDMTRPKRWPFFEKCLNSEFLAPQNGAGGRCDAGGAIVCPSQHQ